MMNQNQHNGTTQNADYVFRDRLELPIGKLTVKVIRGDAWVFTESEDFVLHAGEKRTFETSHRAPVIRSLYEVGFAYYAWC